MVQLTLLFHTLILCKISMPLNVFHNLIDAPRLVNAFGYWQSQDISNASATYLDDLQQAIGHIQSISKSTTKPKIWNGETGWPTDGMYT